MKLEPVKATHNIVSVRCCDCGRWVPCNEIYADLEGIPFKSYYCVACVSFVPDARPVAKWLWKLFQEGKVNSL